VSTYTDLIRAVADLIDKHDLGIPYTLTDGEVSIHDYTSDAPETIGRWRRALGGVWDKRDIGDVITLRQKVASLPGSPTVILFIGKDACVRRVVGTETVTIPAVEAQPERVEEREIVEWDCEPVLARSAS
jgi:hypothetical protein